MSETGLNTAGLNGTGKAIANIANHALLVMVSRFVSIIGVPIALGFFWHMIEGYEAMQADFIQLNQTVAVMDQRVEKNSEDNYKGRDAVKDLKLRDQRIDQNERRIERLERLN